MNAITQNILRDMQNQFSVEFGSFFYGHYTFKEKLSRFTDIMAINGMKMRSLTIRLKMQRVKLVALENKTLKQAVMDSNRELELMQEELHSMDIDP
jgi:hypothetical protein